LNVAQLLAKDNPDMTFCYITGAGILEVKDIVQLAKT
jgi:hypothetical protein